MMANLIKEDENHLPICIFYRTSFIIQVLKTTKMQKGQLLHGRKSGKSAVYNERNARTIQIYRKDPCTAQKYKHKSTCIFSTHARNFNVYLFVILMKYE